MGCCMVRAACALRAYGELLMSKRWRLVPEAASRAAPEPPPPLTEEALLPPVLSALPSRELLRLGACCRQQLGAVVACDDLWGQRIVDDFGGTLERARDWAGWREISALQLHQRLAQLRTTFQDGVIVIQGDLCSISRLVHRKVDAIICPAVPSCGPYGPCAVAVHRAAGPALDAFLHNSALPSIGGRVRVGEALATPAFGLKGVRTIVHAVGPTWQFQEAAQHKLLRQVYDSACRVLEDSPEGPVRCAATASISTGGNGMSAEVAAPIALAALRDAVCFGSLECMYLVLFEGYFRKKFEEVKKAMLARFNEDPAIPEDGSSMSEWEDEEEDEED